MSEDHFDDPRFKMFMHVGHGGGTFMCKLAQLNKENVYKGTNCNLPGDNAGKAYTVMDCAEREARLKLVRQQGKTFGGGEHGFKDGEFCPHLYRYIFYMRDPLDTLNSWVSTRINDTDAGEALVQMIADDPGVTSYRIQDLGRQVRYSAYRLDNFVIRFLSGSNATYFGPLHSINERHLRHAIDTLEHFEVLFTDVDLQQQTEKVERMLHAKLGWKSPLSHLPKNTNSHGVHKLNSSQIEFLRHQNKYDLMLYEHVKAKFAAANY